MDQAFEYARSIYPVRWVIVSDMLTIRLYAVDSQDDYELLDLSGCIGKGQKDRDRLNRLHLLLHQKYLIRNGDESPVSRLYTRSTDQRIALRRGFYEAYCDIRADIHREVKKSCSDTGIDATDLELLQATQRLLDRLVFIYYCEDHPTELIPHDTVKQITQAASMLPGSDVCRVYRSIKLLFEEVDKGSPAGSGLKISGYNGELFKRDRIIDRIDIPDSLHKKMYHASGGRGVAKTILGAWGLYVFDFWTELNEHLLGHIFEQSLSDLDSLVSSGDAGNIEKWRQRKKHGIFYTTDVLSDFLTRCVLQDHLDEIAPATETEEVAAAIPTISSRLNSVQGLRVVDFAECVPFVVESADGSL